MFYSRKVYLVFCYSVGRRRYPRNTVGGYGFGALAVPLLLILFIGFLVPVYSLSSGLAPHRFVITLIIILHDQ